MFAAVAPRRLDAVGRIAPPPPATAASLGTNNNKSTTGVKRMRAINPQYDDDNDDEPLEIRLESALKTQTTYIPSNVFVDCHFYLLLLHANGNNDENSNNNTNDTSSLRQSLSRLIRRGMGTIRWEWDDRITHVIVIGNAAKAAVAAVTDNSMIRYPNSVITISAEWVLRSWQARRRLPTMDFAVTLDAEVDQLDPQKQQQLTVATTTAALSKPTQKQVFRGVWFAFLRLSNPDEQQQQKQGDSKAALRRRWVDFDSDVLEDTVRKHGGVPLSLKLVQALLADQKQQSQKSQSQMQQPKARRNPCYVVCWGGADARHVRLHPILAQVQRHQLCPLVWTTPVWLETCLRVGRGPLKINSSSTSNLLTRPWYQPAPGPWHVLSPAYRVSITGAQGSTRRALETAIRLLGATLEDDLSANTTTHLIVVKSSSTAATATGDQSGQANNTMPSLKEQKAREWKIPIVTPQWLVDGAQHGWKDAPPRKLLL